jgi:hypothetical protein
MNSAARSLLALGWLAFAADWSDCDPGTDRCRPSERWRSGVSHSQRAESGREGGHVRHIEARTQRAVRSYWQRSRVQASHTPAPLHFRAADTSELQCRDSPGPIYSPSGANLPRSQTVSWGEKPAKEDQVSKFRDPHLYGLSTAPAAYRPERARAVVS